jgi:hypothetical protein
MRTLQRGSHNLDVANTLKGVVDAAVSHGNKDLLDGFGVVVFGVDEFSCAHPVSFFVVVDYFNLRKVEVEVEKGVLESQILLFGVDINSNNALRLLCFTALNYGESDASDSKHSDRRTFLDFGRVDGRAVSLK